MDEHSGESKPILFTIGHSNHALDVFLGLLARHKITAVGDVRSQPYSRFNPQFGRERLAVSVRAAGLHYVYLGRELGALREEPEAYRDGRSRFELIRKLPLFQAGLERVRRGVQSHRVALMCAEKDPLTCHRTILICRELRDSMDLRHIREDGRLEGMAEVETRLVELAGLSTAHLFYSREELIAQAYDRQAAAMGWDEAEARVNAKSVT